MASVGAYLRELRTRRGLSLEEIARTTRVAHRYLAALENDAFTELPAPVFIRGFIRAYCQALGESPHEALRHFDGQEGGAVTASSAPPSLPRAGAPEPRPRGTIMVSFVLLVILGMALFTVALVIRPGDRVDRAVVDVRPQPPGPATSADTPLPGPPSAAPPPPPAPTTTMPPSPTSPPAARQPVPAPAPAAPPTPTPGAPTVNPRPPATPPAIGATPETPPVRSPSPAPAATPNLSAVVGPVTAPYRLIARTSESTWIRVRTEDGRSSEETVPAGEVREWVSDRPFVLTVGNAGGVSLELNGRTLPPLGSHGVVIPRLVLPPESR
jgi:cytoskeleton protein RodZ